jgi:hypothetical protein
MKINEDSTEKPKILFNFDPGIKEEYNQVEFLYSYYVSKLRLLKSTNPENYITKEMADTETFYKDMISATACYMQYLEKKKKEHEAAIRESEELSRGFPAE